KGGRALCNMAAARPQPIPVFAEMSSINPVILLPDALSTRGETIVNELIASVVLGAGQFCTNPGLVLGSRSDAFTSLRARMSELNANQPAQSMLSAGGLKSYCHGYSNLRAHPQVVHLAGQEQQGNQAHAQLFKA